MQYLFFPALYQSCHIASTKKMETCKLLEENERLSIDDKLILKYNGFEIGRIDEIRELFRCEEFYGCCCIYNLAEVVEQNHHQFDSYTWGE